MLLIIIAVSVLFIADWVHSDTVIDYGTAKVIIDRLDDESSTVSLDSRTILVPVNYRSSSMIQAGSQYNITFDFPVEWSDNDYWMIITIQLDGLLDHYITIEIDKVTKQGVESVKIIKS